MQMDQQQSGEPRWTAIGQTSNQLILYHPPSHALSVQSHSESEVQVAIAGPSRPRQPLLLAYDASSAAATAELCPYCSQAIPPDPQSAPTSAPPRPALGKTPYFRILERAHEGSRPPSPRLREVSLAPSMESLDAIEPEVEAPDQANRDDVPSRGYYERFFREEKRLGMGAEGSVFLATHIIGGNVLGTYAVKKIAVGDSKDYLVRMLHEVRLLETLRHPNIIPYHHSWIEPTHFSAFGPPINALHVLMMYATAGNLDTFLLTRTHGIEPSLSASDLADAASLGQLPKAERIKAFRKRRASGVGKKEENRGVMMLGLDELLSLFGDVVEGLAFLHSNSVIHLDLKCSNVLLHWEDGVLIPKAMISDFGTSEELLLGQRQRTGHTGTMEYMAPETLTLGPNGQWRPSDSYGDMWSLGLILHKLLFLHLPYTATTEYEELEAEIRRYPGFIPSPDLISSCERRHIPRSLLLLLSKLIAVDPTKRPSADKVRSALKQLRAEPRPGLGDGRPGALVRRGFRRVTDVFTNETASHGDDDVRSIRRWEEDWQMSPVRSMSSPTPSHRPSASISTPLPSASILNSSRVSPRMLKRHRHELRAAAFVLKIISVQPVFAGARPPSVVLGLTLLALCDLKCRSWTSNGALAIAHIALLYATR